MSAGASAQTPLSSLQLSPIASPSCLKVVASDRRGWDGRGDEERLGEGVKEGERGKGGGTS